MARIAPPRRLTFDPKAPFYARRAFRYGGRLYEVGSVFNPRQANCALRKVRSLFESGVLEHAAGHVPEPSNLMAPAVNDGMSMVDLRQIAEAEGAENANSKAQLVDNIIANRKAKDLADNPMNASPADGEIVEGSLGVVSSGDDITENADDLD